MSLSNPPKESGGDSRLREQLYVIIDTLTPDVKTRILFRQKLDALCQEIAREARLDELNKVMQSHKDIEASGTISVPLLIVANRIAELTRQPAEREQ